ncbi:tyrosine-type recombinase/integrase [Halobacteriovorax sp. CON-3]|uniref:tyrosine-type recombinase/integrase n=1 Tax=Halobacteriovorax sp. CON-3 TaxID=3157710 RepID=UPI003714CB8C
MLREFCEQIGIRPITFHSLRACFATQLLNNGVSLPKIMKICGCKGLDTANRYIRLSGVQEQSATESLQFLAS